jgi:monofunctional biosynthetic peptidoglycan transglycosylase
VPARSYPIIDLGEPALADIAPGARKNSMDRSDNSQPPGDDPPTEKTQPRAPAPGTGHRDPAAATPATPVDDDATRDMAPDGFAPEDLAHAAVPSQSGVAVVPVHDGENEKHAAADSDAAPESADAGADTVTQAGSDDAAPIGAQSDAHTESGLAEPPAAQPVAEPAAEPVSHRDAPPIEPEPPPAPSGRSDRPHAADAPIWAHGHPEPLVERLDADRLKDIGMRAAKVAAIVFCAWFAVALLLIAVFRFINPPVSALMVLKFIGGTQVDQAWEPIDRISPNLVRAVITSEDDRFCSHWGIDYDAIATALRRSSKGTPRGASTITMQVAKNMFLWPAKSYVRKVLEVPLTYAIELMWPKWRILEVYLNIAEWGPGVFGAEAAAQSHFDRTARRLSARQAALLAVSLPNPHARNAGRPGAWTSRRAAVIQRRAARSPEAAACVLAGR